MDGQDESLVAGALRELAEETGISPGELAELPASSVVPADIDLHAIPANPAKGEPAHWHADFRFAFLAGAPLVRLQADEVSGYAWRECGALPTGRLAGKIAALAGRAAGSAAGAGAAGGRGTSP